MRLKRSTVETKPRGSARTGAHARLILWALPLLLSLSLTGAAQDSAKTDAAPASNGTATTQKFVKDGVAIEFQVQPVGATQTTGPLTEGQDALVRFKVTDAAGSVVSGLHPAAWIDGRGAEAQGDAKQCRDKVQSFLQGTLSTSADIDLNTYYILALNEEATISVIDPLRGFGTTKLLTLVFLKSPGEDWVMTKDGRRLYVSMPKANAVAVVDTATWKVIDNIDVGLGPVRLALQSDEKYLWVGVDSPPGAKTGGGVTVIDTAARKVLSNVQTGEGRHEIAVTPDNRFAFVSNQSDGTVAVIDVQKLSKVKTLKTGTRPSSLAYSPLGRALYVADESDGTVTAVGGAGWEVRSRVQTEPGLTLIRFNADGRFGFVINQKANVVEVFDAATSRRLNAVPVDKTPDQITFSDAFAYVHSLGSENISLIRLSDIGKAKELSVTKFPGGQIAPEKSPYRAAAAQMVQAPDAGSMLVANPADQQIYYYMEGMGAPSGNFQNYKRTPRALLVLDRSLRETAPGVYSTQVRLDGSGSFDVAFLSDSPRLLNCFSLDVKPDPAEHAALPIKVEHLLKDRRLVAGQPVRLRFKVTDGASDAPKDGLKDLGVLAFLSPGNWQERQWARSVGGGIYEVEFVPPQSGVYYVFVQCPSLKLGYKQLPSTILQAVNEKPAATTTAAPAGGAAQK